MGESESRVNLVIRADIAEATAYARALDAATASVQAHTAALAAMNGIRSGGGGMATGTAATGSAPPAPQPTATGPAVGGTGGPPPPPTPPGHLQGPPPITPQMMQLGGQLAARPSAAAVAGAGQGIPPAPASPLSSNGPGGNYADILNAGGGSTEGAGAGAASFLGNAASTAVGLGLGSSLSGFFTAAPQRYMALDTVITQLGRRFREAGENAAFMGQSIGYTIAESGQLAEALGNQTNSVNTKQFQRYGSFARFTGMDPSGAMSSLGQMERMQGHEVTDLAMAKLMGSASLRGMSQGRMGEFMSESASLMAMGYAATGTASAAQVAHIQGLPAQIYPEGDSRRSGDMSLIGGLQQTMTGSAAMKTYMMRAMGYGREGGPGYIEMRERQEAGIFDNDNIKDLFQSFIDRGMNEKTQFKALEFVSAGALKANQLKALVHGLGSQDKLDAYMAGGTGLEAFAETLDWETAEKFGKGGVTGMVKNGTGMVSTGEVVDIGIEAMMYKVGGPIAKAIPPLQGALENIAGMITKMTGVDWGTLLPNIAANLEKMTAYMAKGDGSFGATKIAGHTVMDSSKDMASRLGSLRFAYQERGVSGLMGAYSAYTDVDDPDGALAAYVQGMIKEDAANASAGGGH